MTAKATWIHPVNFWSQVFVNVSVSRHGIDVLRGQL